MPTVIDTHNLHTPYISTDQFRASSLGMDLTSIDDPELSAILFSASQACDAFTMTKWGYQVIYDEEHPWETKSLHSRWQIYPSFPNVRTVTSFRIMASISGSTAQPVVATVPVTPIGPSPLQPGQAPFLFGQLYVNRAEDYIQTTFLMLQFGIYGAYPTKPLEPIQALLSYTCGYDTGNVSNSGLLDGLLDDGYRYAIPDWLQEATRLVAISDIGERNLNQQGFAGVSQARQGDVEFRRGSGALTASELNIPPAAVRLLKPHVRTTVI